MRARTPLTITLFLGSKGNKTLTKGALYASLALAAYVMFMHVYYVAGQTFITRCDRAVNAVALAFAWAQSALALAQAVDVSRTLIMMFRDDK